jgi:hypothetical protein
MRRFALFGLACYIITAFASNDIASAAVSTFSFTKITNNGGDANVTGQLSVSAYDFTQANTDFGLSLNVNQVLFLFANSGPAASSITDVYFDDGSLLGIASVNNILGVDFSQGASPGDLPGGNAVDFNTTAGFSADSNDPTAINGVNPGDLLGITFDLLAGQTFADTLAAIALGQANPGVDVDGALRIGVHVQAFANGESEGFVNNGPPPPPPPPPPPNNDLPEPISLAIWGIGLALTGFSARKRIGKRL